MLSCITELFWGLCTGYYDFARETGTKAMHPNNLISQFDTSPFQPFAHSLKGSMALFGPSRSLVQYLYRVCACEHDTFTYLLFPLIDSENDVSMSQLLSACEPQSFSKFNNKCQRVESILETNDLPCQKKRANKKVVVLNTRPPDTGRIFFRTKLRGDK